MSTYCLVLRNQPHKSSARSVPGKRFYLTASSAYEAMREALKENPQFRVIGIEPGTSSDSTRNQSEAA